MTDISIVSPLGRGGRTHGGITSYVLSISQALTELNFEVELISFYPRKIDKLADNARDKLKTTIINGDKRKNAAKNLTRHYKSSQPKCILAAGQRFNEIAVSVSLSLYPNLPVYVSVHNIFAPNLDKLNFFRRSYKLYKLQKTFKRASGIVAVSQGVAKDIIKYARVPSQNIQAIYNPVPIQEIKSKASEHLEHSWFLPGQPPVILGVGRLEPQKDFQTLIKAFSLLRKNRRSRLLILGEGTERQKLERMRTELGLEEDVSLPGFQNNPFKFMKNSELFVLSSAWEGLGLVLVEALACGARVVATNCHSGPEEILEGGRYGYLVPPKDPLSMAKAMETALDNKSMSTDIAHALERFEPTNCAREYAQFLNLSLL